MELAAALKGAIRAAGITQERLEVVTGIDQGRISKLANGRDNRRPTLDELRRIEAACGYPFGYILASAGLVTVEGAQQGARARRHTGTGQ